MKHHPSQLTLTSSHAFMRLKRPSRHSAPRATLSTLSALTLVLSTILPLPSVSAAQFGNRQLEMSSSRSGGVYEVGGIGPAGGYIFHIDGDTHYEAAPEDLDGGAAIQWGCRGKDVPGADGTAIGDGAANTEAILDFHNDNSNFNGNDYYSYSGDYEDIGCSSNNNGQVIAKTASEYSAGGYSDWFLPSQDELNLMHQNLRTEGLGGLTNAHYWSSSELDTHNTHSQHFFNGNQYNYLKLNSFQGRAVRVFKSTPNSSTHTFSFELATSGGVGAFRFQYCTNDPFPGEPCDAPNMDASDFQIDSQTGASGFVKDAAQTTTNEIVVTNPSGQNLASGQSISFTFSNIINPAGANQEFFVRIYSYNGTNINTASIIDDGGIASSTAEAMDVTARVQETLQFCVYTGESCNAGGSLADLGILNTTTTQTAQSYFDVSTNARYGVIVQYIGTSLEGSGEVIQAVGGAPTTSQAGTEQYGLQVANITTTEAPAQAASPFASMGENQYIFTPNTLSPIATSNQPTGLTTFAIEYMGNVDPITPTGIYTSDIEYIATGQF